MSEPQIEQRNSHMSARWAWLIVTALTLIAAALRLWQLDALPPGLFFDEAFNGMDARAVAHGEQFPLYFTGNNGREPLYIYLQAIMVVLLGTKAYALRLTSALIGIATIPVTYLCARMIFGDDADRDVALDPTWLALFAAAGMTVSFWHLSVSRLAFRAVLLPPLSMLAIAYFWRAWVRGCMSNYRWTGFWFGLTLYTYTAARLLPLVVIIFLLIEVTLDLIRRLDRFVELWKPRLRGLLWLAAIGLIVLLPLLIAIVQEPWLISSRTGDVSIFTVTEKDMPGTPTQRLLHNIESMARNFYDAGDQNLRHNLPGRPVNDWLLAALFTIGWLTALWRLRAPKMRLLLLWFGVMALPSLLSTNAPHALRAIGMLPPLVLLYAVGAGTVTNWVQRWIPLRITAPVLLAAILLFSGGVTVNDYFNRWAAERELGRAFDLDLQLGAERIAARLADNEAPLLTTRFLYLTPQTRFAIGALPRMDTVPLPPSTEIITLVEDGTDLEQPTFLLQSTAGEWQASWVDIDPSLAQVAALSQANVLRSSRHRAGWPTVKVHPVSAFELQPAHPRYPLNVTFANGMQLLGYDVAPDMVHRADSKSAFRLATYWRVAPGQSAPDSESFDLFVHLVYDGGQVQENGGLGRGYPVDLWQSGEIVDDRRLMPVPSDAALGKAYFEVGLYNPQTPSGIDRIGIIDGNGNVAADSVTFGAVAIDMPTPQADHADLTPVSAIFDEYIELVGWQAQTTPDEPGTLLVELGWRALDRAPSAYTSFVHLLDVDGEIVAQFDQPPGGSDNPTTMWLPGETTRTTFPLTDTPSADLSGYQLRIGLYEPVSGRQLPVTVAADDDLTAGATFVLIPLVVEATP